MEPKQKGIILILSLIIFLLISFILMPTVQARLHQPEMMTLQDDTGKTVTVPVKDVVAGLIQSIIAIQKVLPKPQ